MSGRLLAPLANQRHGQRTLRRAQFEPVAFVARRGNGFDDEIEVDRVDQKGGRGVVLEIDGLGGGFHCLSGIGVGLPDDTSNLAGQVFGPRVRVLSTLRRRSRLGKADS